MLILDFDAYVMRLGEASVQHIVEEAEKANGIRHPSPMPLEYRWNVAINQQAA